MPNRFTKAASDVLNNAMSNARTLGHTYIGTEHILLGLLSVENGVASKLLTNRSVTFEKTRELVSEIAGDRGAKRCRPRRHDAENKKTN